MTNLSQHLKQPLHLPTEPSTDSEKESAKLCARGVLLAEGGKLEEALDVLNRGVAVAPDRAAAYNDRAQLLRLMQKDDGKIPAWHQNVSCCNHILHIYV